MCRLLFSDIFVASCSVERVAAGIAPPTQENKSGIKIIVFSFKNFFDHIFKKRFPRDYFRLPRLFSHY